uniref:Uncharacterized protein n=1 Tax=Anguilla anguilla TaxID=7936 RepID=A0A0E9WLJ5_ANGAN
MAGQYKYFLTPGLSTSAPPWLFAEAWVRTPWGPVAICPAVLQHLKSSSFSGL